MQGVERDSGDAQRGRSQDLPLKGPQLGMRDGHCATRSLQGCVPVTVVGHSGGCVGECGVKEGPPVKGDLGRGLAEVLGARTKGRDRGRSAFPACLSHTPVELSCPRAAPQTRTALSSPRPWVTHSRQNATPASLYS